MIYSKPTLPIHEQISKLQARGLIIEDAVFAENTLNTISYYRLRAYTYPFQDNNNPDHPFIVPVSFSNIIELYKFDAKLRQLIFSALEKIEIAFRTQIIYQWALNHGSHWPNNASLFRDNDQFEKHETSLKSEINRSREAFIEHYKNTYNDPVEPPAWMSLEVSSFGLLSLMFLNLKSGAEKKAITKFFGLSDFRLLENWMHSFSDIRNICAHHSRLWNRRFPAHIKLPTNTKYLFITNHNVYPYKIYPAVCCIEYLLRIVNSGLTLKTELHNLMQTCPLAQEKEMGFPIDWKNEEFWK